MVLFAWWKTLLPSAEKVFSFLKFLNFYLDIFSHVGKRTDEKGQVNFKIYDAIYCGRNIVKNKYLQEHLLTTGSACPTQSINLWLTALDSSLYGLEIRRRSFKVSPNKVTCNDNFILILFTFRITFDLTILNRTINIISLDLVLYIPRSFHHYITL